MSNWCYNPTSTYRDNIESVSRRKYTNPCCIVVPTRPLGWGYNQRSATVIRYHLGIELVPEWLCSDGRGISFQCALEADTIQACKSRQTQWTPSFQFKRTIQHSCSWGPGCPPMETFCRQHHRSQTWICIWVLPRMVCGDEAKSSLNKFELKTFKMTSCAGSNGLSLLCTAAKYFHDGHFPSKAPAVSRWMWQSIRHYFAL